MNSNMINVISNDSINTSKVSNDSTKKGDNDKSQNNFKDALKNCADKESQRKTERTIKNDNQPNKVEGKFEEDINVKKSEEDNLKKEKIKKNFEKVILELLNVKKENIGSNESNVLMLIKNLLNNKITLEDFNKNIDKLNLSKQATKNVKKITLSILEGRKEVAENINKIYSMISQIDKVQKKEKPVTAIKEKIVKELIGIQTNDKYDFIKSGIKDFNLQAKGISNNKLNNNKLNNNKLNNKNDNKNQQHNEVVLLKNNIKQKNNIYKEINNKEDKFLNKLIKEDKDPKKRLIDRATNFMTEFNKISLNKPVSENVEKLTVNKNTFNNDILKSFKFMVNNNMKELTVKVAPKELGEIMIKLTMEGTLMKAKIVATNKETYNILNSNMQDINKALNSQNIKIQSADINIYHGDTTFFSGESSDNQEQNSHSKDKKTHNVLSIDEEETVNETENLYDNNLNELA